MATIIRVSNIDEFVDPSTEETSDVRKPLPLSQVLSNLETLHARCNGTHVCGLSRRFQRFDLADYLALARAYRAAR